MISDMVRQFSKDLEALRLPLEKIPLSQRQLHLSQWSRYILLSNNIRLNIKLVAFIQKDVDKLSAPKHLEKDTQQWFHALKPQGKVDLITESYLLLLLMLHLRFIYEKFPVKKCQEASSSLRRVRCASEGKQAKKTIPRLGIISARRHHSNPGLGIEMPHAFDVRRSEFLDWPLNSIQFV
ncbi:hypothetical protein TNCV_642731 [Trichonephila clavipes]|nr:hypothetical protein TNCV_642731 [Trichonephila clavipes]